MIWLTIISIIGVTIINTLVWGEGKVCHRAFIGLFLSLSLVVSGAGLLSRSLTDKCEESLPRNQHCILIAIPVPLK